MTPHGQAAQSMSLTGPFTPRPKGASLYIQIGLRLVAQCLHLLRIECAADIFVYIMKTYSYILLLLRHTQLQGAESGQVTILSGSIGQEASWQR